MENYQDKLVNARVFSGMIYNGCKMAAWCFGVRKKNLFYTTCPDEKEFLMFFSVSGCFDYIFSESVDKTKPVFVSDDLGMIWAADYIWQNGEPDLVIVIGPVFNSTSSARGIEDSLRKMDFSIGARRKLFQILQKVPVVSTAMMYQYAAMLHYAVSEETMLSYDFQFQHSVQEMEVSESWEEEEGTAAHPVSVERQRTTEETILALVREGNPDYKRIMQELAAGGTSDDYHSSTPIRDSKDTLLIFAALCSRAAMEGGLSQRTAKDMEIQYITRIEQAKTVTELIHIREKMMEDFVTGVHQCKTHPELSRTVRDCCSYIQRNLLKPLELSDIAKEVGYTEYYLTKKFYKEMGVRLQDYIKNSRIELAKIWLVTTQKSIQDISDQLYFGTRNYFSKIFKEKVGITPAAYRDQLVTGGGKELPE